MTAEPLEPTDSVLARDLEASLVAARAACEALQADLACEQEEMRAVEQEFQESLSYRIGSVLCPSSRS